MRNFTFNIASDLSENEQKQLIDAVMHSSQLPTISCGAVTRAEAEAWLRRQHEAYKRTITPERSMTLHRMDITKRVRLIDLTDEEGDD